MPNATTSDAAVQAAGNLIRAGRGAEVVDFLLDCAQVQELAADPYAGLSALFARYDHAIAADDEPILTRRHLRALASDGRARRIRVDVPTVRRTA